MTISILSIEIRFVHECFLSIFQIIFYDMFGTDINFFLFCANTRVIIIEIEISLIIVIKIFYETPNQEN